MDDRPFVPETQPFYPEKGEKGISFFLGCHKPENHDHYITVDDLSIDHLPEGWRSQGVVDDLKAVARRVVHITVVRPSPTRGNKNLYGQYGSGFLRFDPKHGPIINTSKHVVLDPYEANHTIIRLFYNDDENIKEVFEAEGVLRQQILQPHASNQSEANDNEFFMFRGSSRYFRSVMCSDYTAFSCEGLPVHSLFPQREIERANAAFSWRNFSWTRLVMSPPEDIDVAVISHPHGGKKAVSFGKMNKMLGMEPSLYTTPTCSGSSGAPVIRLHSDSVHYISAGQFVHHGHWKEKLDMGMGTVRPPFTFPYSKSMDTKFILLNMISILYEPVFYWTLYVCGFLHIRNTWTAARDNFAYFSSLCALLFSTDAMSFKVLFTGFWLHVALTTIFSARKLGIGYALYEAISSLIAMSMFLAGWTLLFLLPWSITNMVWVIVVWAIVLFVERYFQLQWRFMSRTMGSYADRIHYMLSMERKDQAKKMKDSDLITTQKRQPVTKKIS